jgi:hypothetical protein
MACLARLLADRQPIPHDEQSQTGNSGIQTKYS